ncbi:MAG: glycosyltransferase family 39 protein [Patescibacteria group bacterium]
MQKFWRFNKEKNILLLIILLGFALRAYNLNWDQGFHLHPDERAIVMYTTPLHFPSSLDEFFSQNSSWNPHFFAYGNFPLYLLKIAGLAAGNFDPSFSSYDKINLVGRFMSGIFDIATIFVIFFLGKKLFNKKTGILASFFYTISVFPIQASHFYAVDIPLTFFILLTLYQLVRFYEKPSLRNSILVGVCFGASLATKISAIPLLAAITAAITIDFLLLVAKQPHKSHIWFPHVPRFLKRFLFDGVIILASTAIIFSILQPYAIIDFSAFWRQNMEQSQMTRDPFTFPYTLQYVGKIPYLYELKNIFFWGQGPILATLSFLGIFYAMFLILKKDKQKKWAQEAILVVFFWVYFFVVGKFAVGWMRYILPLYPLLCLFGAVFAMRFIIPKINLLPRYFSSFIFPFSFFILIIWPLSFMHIYTEPNTRVLASEWIYKNIPPNSIIAREHWDDGLPIGGTISYQILELPIYEMENPLRENQIYQTVQEADYIIIASNRLYVPLQRLAKNCQKWNLPLEKCSRNANRYYDKLFSGELGYKKVAEFENPPTIPLFNISINDFSADESFTVYDHPKVMIFKKEEKI